MRIVYVFLAASNLLFTVVLSLNTLFIVMSVITSQAEERLGGAARYTKGIYPLIRRPLYAKHPTGVNDTVALLNRRKTPQDHLNPTARASLTSTLFMCFPL